MTKSAVRTRSVSSCRARSAAASSGRSPSRSWKPGCGTEARHDGLSPRRGTARRGARSRLQIRGAAPVLLRRARRGALRDRLRSSFGGSRGHARVSCRARRVGRRFRRARTHRADPPCPRPRARPPLRRERRGAALPAAPCRGARRAGRSRAPRPPSRASDRAPCRGASPPRHDDRGRRLSPALLRPSERRGLDAAGRRLLPVHFRAAARAAAPGRGQRAYDYGQARIRPLCFADRAGPCRGLGPY